MLSSFVLCVGVASYFGFTVLTGDTLASAVAALLAGVAAWLTHRTQRKVDPSIKVDGKSLTLGDVVERLARSHVYLRRRFHDVLGAEYRSALYLWRIGKHLGIPAEEWPKPTPPDLSPIDASDLWDQLGDADPLI